MIKLLTLLLFALALPAQAVTYLQATAGGACTTPTVDTATDTYGDLSGGTGTSVDVAYPATVNSGDVLVAFVMTDDTGTTDQITNDAGNFTKINWAGGSSADAHAAAFYRVATGSETGSETFNTDSSFDMMAFMVRVTGAGSTQPDVVGADYSAGAASSHDLPAITTGEDCTVAFGFAGSDGGDTYPYSTSSTGWTKGNDGQNATSSFSLAGGWFYKPMDTAGSTGTLTVNISSSDGLSGSQFSIAP